MAWIKPKASSKQKYGNIRAGKYDSKKEKRRADDLALLQKAGEISDLKEQVRFELIPRQYKDDKMIEREAAYIADFTYMEDGELVVEDVKSAITRKNDAYILKRKLMLFIHGIRIRET